MEYLQTHTLIFFATPLPHISGITPLEENFYHSFVALTLIGG